MSEAVPAPLTTVDMDLAGFDCFYLNVERLLGSELWAISTGEEFKAAVGLWCRAWKQSPAGSLPDDDRVLAAFAGVPRPRWRKIRDIAMRGFLLCADGRWYHQVLCEDVVRAHHAKQANRKRTEGANKARHGSRDDARNVANDATRDVPRDVSHDNGATFTHREGEGEEEREKPESPSSGVPSNTGGENAVRTRGDGATAAAANRNLSLRINAVTPKAIEKALATGDALAVIRCFGGNCSVDRQTEWMRDTDGLQLGTLAAILWWRYDERESIREPSGFRAVRADWKSNEPAFRAEVVQDFAKFCRGGES